MGIVNYTYNRSTSGGEIITHLINATDGEGLHFDGAAGSVAFTPVDLGTKFSFEFIVQADSWGTVQYLTDFGTGGRFFIGAESSISYNLGIASTSSTPVSFGVKVLDDLKVHHLVVTVDGTSAILYDNGNQVGTATITSPDIDSCTVAAVGSNFPGSGYWFDGTLYRTRLWNRTLTAAEVTASFENATVPFADQYGSQTVLISVVTGLDGWDASNTWNSQTTAGSNMILSATALNQYCRTNTALEVGKKYRLTYTATGTTTAYFGGNWAGGFTDIHQISDGTRSVEFTFEFAAGFTDNYFYCYAGGPTAGVTLSNLSLVEIGCAVDLDLAFANPTQSLTVQDRAGNADGTASATGVVQVTKLEQVNTNKIAVGGTTPLVGIGLAAGSTPAAALHTYAASGDVVNRIESDSAGAAYVQLDGTQVSNAVVGGINFYNAGDTVAAITVERVDANDAADLYFRTQAAGGGNTERLRIASDGKVTLTADGLALKIDGSANTTKGILLRNTGTQHGYLQTDGDLKIIAEDAGKTIKFYTVDDGTGTPRLTIDSAGNVGIGIAPTELFHVNETNTDVEEGVVVRLSTTAGGALKFGVTDKSVDATTWFAQTGSAESFIIRTGGANNRLTIDGSTGLATFANGIDVSNGFLTIGDYSELTIATGAITVTGSLHHVDTESDAASDDLDTINGGSTGTIISLCPTSSARTVVLKDGTGNLALAGDFSMDSGTDLITLLKIGGTWTEQSRSNNA